MQSNDSFYDSNQTSCFIQIAEIFIRIQISEGTVMTCANLLVALLHAFMIQVNRKKIPNFLLLSQSCTDLYIAMCLWFELLLNGGLLEETMSKEWQNLVNVALLEYSLVLSIGTLFLGAIERYLSITKTYFHKRYITLVRMVYATIFIWIISLLPTVILLWLMDFNAKNIGYRSVIIYSFVFDALMLLLISYVLFTLLITLNAARSSCSHQLQLTINYSSPERRRVSADVAKKKSIRLLVIFISMIISYIVTYLPILIGRVLYDSGELSSLHFCDQTIFAYMCHVLYKFSALSNPFLTIILKGDYRMTLYRIAKGQKNEPTHGKHMKMPLRKFSVSINGTVS